MPPKRTSSAKPAVSRSRSGTRASAATSQPAASSAASPRRGRAATPSTAATTASASPRRRGPSKAADAASPRPATPTTTAARSRGSRASKKAADDDNDEDAPQLPPQLASPKSTSKASPKAPSRARNTSTTAAAKRGGAAKDDDETITGLPAIATSMTDVAGAAASNAIKATGAVLGTVAGHLVDALVTVVDAPVVKDASGNNKPRNSGRGLARLSGVAANTTEATTRSRSRSNAKTSTRASGGGRRTHGSSLVLPQTAGKELTEEEQEILRQHVAEQGVMTMADHLHAAIDGSTENQDPPHEGEEAKLVPTQSSYSTVNTQSVPIKPEDRSLPLYSFEQIPHWMQHNPFILTSYRAHYSVSMCLRSLFKLHTETGNVWTHLLGLLFFIGLMTYCFINVIKPEISHIIVFSLFSLGNCLCMGFSACFHLFSAHHCERVFSRMIMMDYFGITSLIIVSFYPVCYYAFSCELFYRWLYMAIISALGLIGLVGPFFDFFLSDDFSVYRLLIFCGLAGSGCFPLIHVNFLMPTHQTTPFVQGIALMLFLYGCGVVVYVFKVPERLRPGRFDVWLQSHQLWHVFVLAASAVHSFTCLDTYMRWNTMERQC